MNSKTAKKLRRRAKRLAMQTALAADEKGLVLRHWKGQGSRNLGGTTCATLGQAGTSRTAHRRTS